MITAPASITAPKAAATNGAPPPACQPTTSAPITNSAVKVTAMRPATMPWGASSGRRWVNTQSANAVHPNAAEDAQPNVLYDVLGRVVLADDSPHVVPERPVPPLDQLVEGGPLAQLAAYDEPFVFQHVILQ